MNLLPKKLAIYIRVSTKKQANNTSKTTQLETINALIKSNGWEGIPYEIYDDTKSASFPPNVGNLNTLDEDSDISNPSVFLRAGLRKLFYDAMFKKFDKLIVYSHDRLSRDAHESLLIKHTLNKLNIDILYSRPGEQINSENNSMNTFLENLLSNLSALESNIIGGRTFMGNRGNILNNIWAGGPAPYGYKLVQLPSNKRKSKLSINPPEARIVKNIFDLYTLGYSPRNIVDYIKTEYSHNNDRLWTINSIKSILSNPTYTGTITWNKKGGARNPRKRAQSEYTLSKFDENIRLITDDTWNKTQYLKALQKNNPKFLSTTFLLKGILICVECGEYFSCKNHGNSSGEVYYCRHKDNNDTNLATSKETFTIKTKDIHNIIFYELNELITSLSNTDNNFDMLYANYLTHFSLKNETLQVEKSEIITGISDSENMISRCSAQIDIIKKNAKVDSSDKIQYEKYLCLLTSIKEFSTNLEITKTHLGERLKKLNKKLSNPIQTKEDFKNHLIVSLTPLENIFNEKSVAVRNRCLRLLLINVLDSIKMHSMSDIEIIFK